MSGIHNLCVIARSIPLGRGLHEKTLRVWVTPAPKTFIFGGCIALWRDPTACFVRSLLSAHICRKFQQRWPPNSPQHLAHLLGALKTDATTLHCTWSKFATL